MRPDNKLDWRPTLGNNVSQDRQPAASAHPSPSVQPRHVAMETAEAVRLNPASTDAQFDAQRAILQSITDTI